MYEISENHTKRKRFLSKFRLNLFLERNSTCQACQSKIHPGQKWEIDHIIPLAIGGDNSPQNLQVLCKICHRFKTNTQDLSAIAKIKRIKIKHLGAKSHFKRLMPGNRKSRWKKKLNGQVVKR